MTQTARSSLPVVPISAQSQALFLDFDGTLAPLQDDPDKVSLPANGADILHALHNLFGTALVLISGRDIRDLSARTPHALWRAGGHGLEICRPGETPAAAPDQIADRTRADVEAIIRPFAGVRIEDKGPVLAIHYRQNPGAESRLIEQMQTLVQAIPDYKVQNGKCVIELKPVTANKGRALAHLMQRAPFSGRQPVMVGDDTTDEDAMMAAAQLGGFGIKVGAGDTCATYRMADPDMVWTWLRKIVNEHA
jgi:trehalose 6-phosphate phosphatase